MSRTTNQVLLQGLSTQTNSDVVDVFNQGSRRLVTTNTRNQNQSQSQNSQTPSTANTASTNSVLSGAQSIVNTPTVPPNVIDKTVGDLIVASGNKMIRQNMFLYNNGTNTIPSFSRHIVVYGNCNTSANYYHYVDIENLQEQYPNKNLPFSYYFQIEKSPLRFQCFASWTWNLNMNVGLNLVTNTPQINIYDEIYIYPHNKLVRTCQLTRYNNPSSEYSTQYNNVWGYRNQNDIFILLPDIEICYVGQKFNFYICKKAKNVYNPVCVSCCEEDSCTIPTPYQALLHQNSVNIYIFASDSLNRRNNYISDVNNREDGLIIGQRVMHSDDKSIYYVKLDNETYFNESQCSSSPEKVFGLNPGHMFDYWKVEMTVVSYNETKRFHVDTPLPPYINKYTTPITTLPSECENGGSGIFSNGVDVL